jgi:hypothetical protein
MTHLNFIDHIARTDCDQVRLKEETYRGSWKKRGGIGAFMMLARKWDRIEEMMIERAYDIFREPGDGSDGTPLAEIRDLRRYLLLVESELVRLDESERGIADLTSVLTAAVSDGVELVSDAALYTTSDMVPSWYLPRRAEDMPMLVYHHENQPPQIRGYWYADVVDDDQLTDGTNADLVYASEPVMETADRPRTGLKVSGWLLPRLLGCRFTLPLCPQRIKLGEDRQYDPYSYCFISSGKIEAGPEREYDSDS